MSNSKNVVFDVVGTLISYDHLFEAIDSRLGERLRESGIQPKLLGACWLETADREYTFLSLSGRYVPFYKIFEGLFYRILMYAGIKEPRKFATPEDVSWLVGEWRKLGLTPGAAGCIQKLRDAGFTVWCFTTGDIERVKGYFEKGGIDMPAENLLTCDSSGVAKPDPNAYKPVLEKLAEVSSSTPWFAAAHMWDVSTARTVGFKGAYSTVLEAEPLHEIYGDMEVVADSLPGMADGIITAEEPNSPTMPPSAFPQTNQSTLSFWRSNPHALDDHRTTPDLPTSADIVIVGAGYAGASVAHHILALQKSHNIQIPSIVILEAREACSGATGRNGGHLKPDLYGKPSAIAASHGIQAGIEIAEFEASHIPAIKKLVEEEEIDCDFVLTRCVDVLMTDELTTRVKAGVNLLKQHNVSLMDDVFFASGSHAEQISGVKNANSCFTYTSAHLFPYKLILHLLAEAVASGVNLQTHTPVTSTTTTPSPDGIFTVSTPRGAIKTRKIMYATNANTSALLPSYTDKIIPVRGVCSHISFPDQKQPPPFLPNSYVLRAGAGDFEYLIPRPDGSVVLGGARAAYYHDFQSWYDNVDDDVVIEGAREHFEGYMQRHFCGWEGSGAEVGSVWTGVMGYTSDGLPHIGKIPGYDDQYILAGFNGHGMPQIFLAAKGIAEMVVLGKEFRETGIPRVFETTQERLESPENGVLEGWEDYMKEKEIK
ncbi:DAO-domain-containing protein [Periconia macrospinosa]|uniref:DAO-domain-containing protein n=1 Tax=Periconia macrospinosa TaxID=97972 RepID=A0A2V1DXF7_9PLEO|nr:DAO-domain-containing protein [Periconia macrospinosa]